jgi:hypothetical protein
MNPCFISAPGGSIIEDPEVSQYKTDTCVFRAKQDFPSLKAYYDVRTKCKYVAEEFINYFIGSKLKRFIPL